MRCRLCQSGAFETVYEGLNDRLYGVGNGEVFAYVRCRNCGLVQLAGGPSGSALAEYYREYKHRGKEGLLYSVFRRLVTGHAYYFPRRQPGGLLDFGCGTGWYLQAMARRGWQCRGCEFESEYARQLSEQIGFPVVTPRDLCTESTHYCDLVTFNFSLEHLEDPLASLRCAATVLRRGGEVYITLPNVAGKEARLWGRNWLALDPPRHITLPDRGNITAMLDRTGFKVQTIRNIPLATGFSGSLSYALTGRFNRAIWYGSILFGMAFSTVIRDGTFAVHAIKI